MNILYFKYTYSTFFFPFSFSFFYFENAHNSNCTFIIIVWFSISIVFSYLNNIKYILVAYFNNYIYI